MTARRGTALPLDPALWAGGAAGVLGTVYFILAANGLFLASSSGLLWPAATALLLLAITATAAGAAARSATNWFYLAAGGAFALALTVLNLLPPVARDELTHHLALPQLFLRHGSAAVFPFAEQSYFPMQVTLLYTPLLAQGWESAPKYLHLLFGLASIGILYLYLSECVAIGVAGFVALLLLTTPTFATLASSAYVDLGLFFFTTVSVVALLRWSVTERTGLLALSGFTAGCAASVKYNGYLMIPLLLVGTVALSSKRTPSSVIGNLALFGLLALIPLAPWLVRNYFETGNPVFPLMRGTFGGPPRGDSPTIDIFTRRMFLYNESWLEILTTPFRAFVVGRFGDPARFDGAFNPLFLLGFAGVIAGRRSVRGEYLWIVSLMVLVMVFFLTTFRSRYAIAALVPLAILLAEMLDRWRTTLPRARVLLPALAAAALSFNLWHFVDYWTQLSPTAFLTGRESRSGFISRFVPEYPVADFANQTLGPDSKVYLAFLGQRGYYWRQPYTYDYYYSGTSLRDAVRGASSAAAVSADLRKQGISHIAASAPHLGRFLQEDLNATELQRWESFAAQHLRLIRSHGSFGLYEII